MLSSGWEGIKNAGSAVKEGGLNLLSKGAEGIKSIGTSLSESGIGGTLSKGWEGLKSGFWKGAESYESVIEKLYTGVGTSWSKGGGALLKGVESGGLKGLAGAAGSGLKAYATKANVIGAVVGGLIDTGINLSEGKDWKESLGRAAISGIAGFAGGALGSLLLPGAGTVAGSIGGSMLGDKIGDWIFGEKGEEGQKASASKTATANGPDVNEILKNSKPIDIQGLKNQKPTDFTKTFLPTNPQNVNPVPTAKSSNTMDMAKSAASSAMLDMILPGAGLFSSIKSLFGSTEEADDLYSPGYGKRTLTTPEGTYGLNDDDHVVASTSPTIAPIMQQPATVTAAPEATVAAPGGPAMLSLIHI